MINATSRGGSPERSSPSGRGVWEKCAARSACGVRAANGGPPASISYAITPNE